MDLKHSSSARSLPLSQRQLSCRLSKRPPRHIARCLPVYSLSKAVAKFLQAQPEQTIHFFDIPFFGWAPDLTSVASSLSPEGFAWITTRSPTFSSLMDEGFPLRTNLVPLVIWTVWT